MESLKRLYTFAMRITIVLLALGAIILYQLNIVAAKGYVIGGLAGLLGLWILYRQTVGLAHADAAAIQTRSMVGAILRLPVYGAALIWAHRLDTESNYGLLAAVGGLFIIHGVLMFLGITGMDMKEDGQ